MDNFDAVLSQKTFYHGGVSRDEAAVLIKGKVDGSFLLRKSLRNDGSYVISVACNGDCLHYSVAPCEKNGKIYYSINNGTPYLTPLEVCEHYMGLKGGLKVKLEFPVGKSEPDSDSIYVMETEWFHNEITREEDSRRLSQAYRSYHKDGIFLVRKKDSVKHVLCVVNAGSVHRYIIYQNAEKRYFITGKKRDFASLEELVQFHMNNPTKITGIQCQLTIACPKKFHQPSSTRIPAATVSSRVPSKALNSFASLASELQRCLPKNGLDIPWAPDSNEDSKDLSSTQVDEPSSSTSNQLLDEFQKACRSEPEDCPGYTCIYQNLMQMAVAPDMYIKENDISVYKQLGKGHFGAVCLARCRIFDQWRTCAVKYLTGDDIMANKKELLMEATLLQSLDHPNIIRLIAVCDTDVNLMMLLELAPLGHLKNFLKKSSQSIPEGKILNLMHQVAEGMAYLSSKNIVHRDLAARNILLVSENFAKVSDFGMSKVLMEMETYYRCSRPGSWPLRWYPPEALLYYKFTTKLDVWSYGVTLWEAFSYGAQPYQGMKGSEILQMLENNERLDCPVYCPPDVYDLMLYCWTYDESDRPDFNQISSIIDEMVKKYHR